MSEERFNLLSTCFSGSDTMAFFDGKYIESVGVWITRNTMSVIFPVISGMERFLYSNNKVDFHLVSVSELGKLGLISGTCIVDDFKLVASVDNLSIEVSVDFKSELTKILGHWSNKPEEQEEIKAIYGSLKGTI